MDLLVPFPALIPDIHERIDSARPYESEDFQVRTFRAYAAGKQTLILTLEQKAILEGILKHRFCDNVCHQIISEASDRLELLRWDCEDEGTKQFLSDLYTGLNLDDISGTVHFESLRDGNHALAVDWDSENSAVIVVPEAWWDGWQGVWIAYDELDRPAYAVKEWLDDTDGWRRVVYYADRIERYIAGKAGNMPDKSALDWQPHILEDDDGQWPVMRIASDGTPLGIPFVHFPNAARRVHRNYGVSEIDGGVLGFQDQLNDSQYDMSAVLRMTGFQMITISGIILGKINPKTGQPDEFGVDEKPQVGPGQILTSTNPQTKFDVLKAGEISQIIDGYMHKLKSVCRMTRTPLHAITGGEWPSGEALLRAELPAEGKARKQIKKFTSCWTDVAVLAIRVSNAFGNAGINVDLKTAAIRAVFAPADRRDALSRSVIVANLGDRISDREALRLMGIYTTEQIENIMDEKKQEAIDFAPPQLATNPDGTVTPTPKVKPNTSNIGRTDKTAV